MVLTLFRTVSEQFRIVLRRFRIVFGSFRPGVWPDVRPGVRPDVRAAPVSSEEKKKTRGVWGAAALRLNPSRGGVWDAAPPSQIFFEKTKNRNTRWGG